MVKKRQDNGDQDDMDITNEPTEIHEPDLEEIEAQQQGFTNTLREKLKACEAEKRNILEESQRAKADFLNARKRLEEERRSEKERVTIKHIETLIPLCDSFHVAISNKETWEKVDETWRRGILGIQSQLQNILESNQVYEVDPTGQKFDPRLHEALSTIPVSSEEEHDTVRQVVQLGYQMRRTDGTSELIRPARVVIGNFAQN